MFAHPPPRDGKAKLPRTGGGVTYETFGWLAKAGTRDHSTVTDLARLRG